MPSRPPEAGISVVIPCYNRAAAVAAAIRSALGQEPRPLEVIVVDDGSTDGSAGAAAAFGPPVRVLRTPHRGAAAARNTGIAAARGRWIAFLDSDDLWLPGKLALQAGALGRFPEAALVFCDTAVYRGPEVILPSRFALGGLYGAEVARHGPVLRFDRGLFGPMLTASRIITSAVMVRRDLPELAFAPGLEPSEDWALWIGLALRYPLAAVDRVLVRMARAGDNISARRGRVMRANLRTLDGLLGDPALMPAERGAVAALVPTVRAGAMYCSLAEGEAAEARRLLRDIPPGSLGLGRWLRYWLACRAPRALVRRVARRPGGISRALLAGVAS